MSPARPAARRLPVGVALGPAADGDLQGAFRLAERAERLGVDSVWLPESHFRAGAIPSPLVVLAALASRTARVALGTTSLLLPIRAPGRLAGQVAALDVLCGGRLRLGLGRGFEPGLFRAHGLDPRAKRDRFDTALDAMLAAWSAPGPGPRTVQRPHPPLYVAAFGPKGLRQAARRALPYLASPLEDWETLGANQALHREHLPPHAKATDLEAPVMRTVHVAASGAESRRVREALERELEAIARRAAPRLARAAAGGTTARALVGEPAEVMDQLADRRERVAITLLIARPAPATTEAERTASLERLLQALA